MSLPPKLYRKDEQNEQYFKEGCYVLELMNVDDSRDLSVARVRVEPGQTTHWHRLRGTQERYVMLSGSAHVEVSGDAAIAKDIGAFDVVDIPADAAQRIKNTGSEDLMFLAICTPAFRERDYVDLGQDSVPIDG